MTGVAPWRSVLALAGIALLTAVPGAAARANGARCHARQPTGLSLERLPDASAGRLRWRAPRSAPARARYRVYRNGRTLGQTAKRSMRVRVSLGRSFRFKVAVVGTGCSAQKRLTLGSRGPSVPLHLAAGDGAGAAVRLSWSPSQRGDAPLVGYRIFRDGSTYGQSQLTWRDVPVASNRSYRFSVAAVDHQGRLSARSEAVTVRTGHHAPDVPAGVEAVAVDERTVGVTWQPSADPHAGVTAYRLLRDGRVVTQVRGSSAVVGNLAPGTAYRFQVQAVDGLGYVSDPSPAVVARTQDPDPTSGHAQAWLLASTGQSFADFRAHYREIGSVYPTYYDCDAAGALAGSDDPLVTRWAQARQVRVMPRVNCQRTPVVHAILTDPATRQRWLAAMLDLVDRYGYDGVALDLETGPAADRAAMTSFVAELADALHARGKRLTQAVSAKTWDNPTHSRGGVFDYAALAQHDDTVFVMAWGIHWATSAPGASDDLDWVTQVADYVATQPDPRKFVLGVHLYAMDWAAGGGPGHPAQALEYDDVIALIARLGATPVLDPASGAYHFSYVDGAGVGHAVWFGDATTVTQRLQVARSHGMGGVGFWRLGREDQRLWDDPLLAPGAGW
jgi:spore germination protein YaaH